MFRLSKTGLVKVSGAVSVPEVFIGYKLLALLVESNDARVQFLNLLGKEAVIVELFKEERGQYMASIVVDTAIPEDSSLEGVGFCEKL